MFRATTASFVLPVSAKSSEITGEYAHPHAGTRVWTREQFTRDVSPLLSTVYRLCLALSDNSSAAEDLLQSALVRAYVHRESFRGDGALAAWLCCIVRNEHIELVRQTARRRGLVRGALERFGQLFEDWSGTPDPGPELSLSIAEETEDVLAALQELPEQYRSAVWMCDVEEMSYQLASEALGIPIGTVKSRHARGRAKLRAALARRRAREGA
jgi:RNA polymerase sigma-70 factor, ECF subfamily